MLYHVLIFIAVWLLCGFIGAGFMCQYSLSRFSILYKSKKDMFWYEWEDFWFSLMFGPIGLIVTVLGGYIRYGWKMPFTYKENNK